LCFRNKTKFIYFLKNHKWINLEIIPKIKNKK
jgi:hypothetical protein